MILLIVIFSIAILVALGMLVFRAWELRTGRVHMPEQVVNVLPELSFRQVEKSMLYLTKHVIQAIVINAAKYWFIAVTKIRKFVEDKWPKIHDYFMKKPESPTPVKPSFVQRAVLESKAKIKKIKQKIKEEHGV